MSCDRKLGAIRGFHRRLNSNKGPARPLAISQKSMPNNFQSDRVQERAFALVHASGDLLDAGNQRDYVFIQFNTLKLCSDLYWRKRDSVASLGPF